MFISILGRSELADLGKREETDRRRKKEEGRRTKEEGGIARYLYCLARHGRQSHPTCNMPK
jgi:hypothetical protein